MQLTAGSFSKAAFPSPLFDAKYIKMHFKSAKNNFCFLRYLGFLIIFAADICLSSCYVYGPETEHKSALDILNEKNYQQVGSVLGASVIAAKRRNTVIKGTVYLSEFVALKFEKLKLVDNKGTTVAETTTSNLGKFEFNDYITNGNYTIKIESLKYFGEIKIRVDNYLHQDIIIEAKPNLGVKKSDNR